MFHVEDSSVIPGCSGPLLLGQEPPTEVLTLEQQVSLPHLHANVSADGTMVMVEMEAKVPDVLSSTCQLHLSLSSPITPPQPIASAVTNCLATKHTFLHLPPHTYYNVCAALQLDNTVRGPDLCLLAAAPRLRTTPRSVMPLLLTLVFLALGIACLTVLYLIVSRHRADSKPRPRSRGRGWGWVWCWSRGQVLVQEEGEDDCL